MFDGRCLMFDVKTRKPESGRQKEIADCGLRIAECGMRRAGEKSRKERALRNADCGMWKRGSGSRELGAVRGTAVFYG